MKDNRIFKAEKIDAHRAGWIADLSPAEVVNPDFYYRFTARWQAQKFIDLVDGGTRADEAAYIVSELTPASYLGHMTSDAKANAARANGKRPVKPGSRQRGRPRNMSEA